MIEVTGTVVVDGRGFGHRWTGGELPGWTECGRWVSRTVSDELPTKNAMKGRYYVKCPACFPEEVRP